MSRSVNAPRRGARPTVARPEVPASVLDSLITWMNRLPMPAWVFCGSITVAAVILRISLRWLDGARTQGQLVTPLLWFDATTIYPLALMYYLNTTARGSLRAFEPALGKLRIEYPRLEAALTSTSARAAWWAFVVAVFITALGVSQDPASWGIEQDSSAATRIYILAQGIFFDFVLVAMLLHLVQQLRCIARIHRDATNIDLHERSSHHAFSRLTLAAALGLLAPIYPFVLLVMPFHASSLSGGKVTSMINMVIVATVVLLSAAVFVVPLYGMRRRLEDLKKDAVQQCDRRFQSTVKRLHARLDSGSLKDLGGFNHAMATLTLEREALQRISTWPWAADTLRRYLSSVALPVFVFLVARYIGRFLGL